LILKQEGTGSLVELEPKATQEQIQGKKHLRERVTFMLTPALITRLGHYVVDQRPTEKSKVVEQAIDKFLTEKGY
jgi:hypothetical protein